MGRPRTGKGYVTLKTEREHQKVLRELGIEPSGLHAHHIDGDVRNNSVSNLQLLTQREHMKLHAGTSGEPNSNDRVEVLCPSCGRVRSVLYRAIKRAGFTGLCRSCCAAYFGGYNKRCRWSVDCGKPVEGGIL